MASATATTPTKKAPTMPPPEPPAVATKDIYLIQYNAFCCLGWAYILAIGIPSFVQSVITATASGTTVIDALKLAGGQLYFATPATAGLADETAPSLATMLTLVQSAAILEIVHAALGLVRSPVFVTMMQVGSRIVALHMINHSPTAQTHWGAALMILSWALVEVPRYLFYVAAIATGDATKGTPYPLFWLRYSLFAVLYPTGIAGELSVFFNSSKDSTFLSLLGTGNENIMYWYAMAFPIIYAPGALPMIMNMAGNRKRAFKNRFAKPPPPPRGLVWPVTEVKNGIEVRSSTPTSKEILAAAIGAVNPDLAQLVLKEKKWRFKYVKHLINMVEAQCKSPEDALKVANAGLDKAYSMFQFISKDGKTTTSFAEAMAAKNDTKFCTGYVKGELAPNPDKKVEIAYKGRQISGEELKAQVKKWVDYGTIEPSAGEAILKCAENPKWIDLRDQYFVLLGAGSAMGPFEVLMSLGANVIAIDLDRPQIFQRLIDITRKSSGSITFPMTKEQKDCKNDEEMYGCSGCNLFTETPLIRDWLVDLYPGKSFTVGSYAYLNGALHVQVSLAMDAICRDLCEKRKGMTSLAYLCTPTDLHLIPKDAHDSALANYKEFSKKPFCMLMKLLAGKKVLRKNVRDPVSGEGGDFYYVNGISVAQGPNYALAKRMQHWRAVIARSKGSIVSSNVAPSTSTVSVTQNRTFAWAYEGMPYFKPYEIFAPETSKSVMIAILFHDLNNPESVANPKTKLANPNQLFSYGAFHGGTWRCAYEIDSIGESSVLLYFSRVAAPYALAIGGIGIAFGAKYFGVV